MGLSALPAPSDGVLVLFLVNTALSISLFKDVVRSFLHVVGLHRTAARDDELDEDGVGAASDRPAGESFSGRFRSRIKPVRFGALGAGDPEGRAAADCRVCLTGFEPESTVVRLPCGHLFHEACLGRWLEDYHHVTCPLCRSRLLPLEESSSWLWC